MDMDSPFSEYSIKRHLNLVSDLGSSSRPFLRRRSLALSAAAPDLGRGAAPLAHALVRRSQPPALLSSQVGLRKHHYEQS